MAITLSEETRLAAMQVLTDMDPRYIYECANVVANLQHTEHYYFGGACKCCRRTKDSDQLQADLREAEVFYAQQRLMMAERAPA